MRDVTGLVFPTNRTVQVTTTPGRVCEALQGPLRDGGEYLQASRMSEDLGVVLDLPRAKSVRRES